MNDFINSVKPCVFSMQILSDSNLVEMIRGNSFGKMVGICLVTGGQLTIPKMKGSPSYREILSSFIWEDVGRIVQWKLDFFQIAPTLPDYPQLEKTRKKLEVSWATY